jgi:hypothetical protein
MTEHHFHLPLNPLLNVLFMAMLWTGSILMNLIESAHSLVPFAQIVACAMTVFVGYRTLKKMEDDNSKPKK